MSRTVSTPSGAEVVCYRDTAFGYNELGDFDEFVADAEWELFVEDIVETSKSYWPSFVASEKWLGREDNALLENELTYLGVSEYCGIAAIWLVPKSDYGGCAEHWCQQIAPKFHQLFGELQHVATFSNGEGLYRKVK